MGDNARLGSMPLFSSDPAVMHFDNGVHMLRYFANVCIIETEEGAVIFDHEDFFAVHGDSVGWRVWSVKCRVASGGPALSRDFAGPRWREGTVISGGAAAR